MRHTKHRTQCIVFDMTDFSMANMDYAPVKFMIKCFEANYPESLGVVLVHKSPWIFNAVWKIIKGWLDPVVASKVHFTRNLDELAEFVALDHIPHEEGGKDPWTYNYVGPVSGENAKMDNDDFREKLMEGRRKVVREYEAVTQHWMHSTGSSEVVERRKALTEELRAGYWELDPYVRARTFYDRTGMIRFGGGVQFYPPTETQAAPMANGGAIPAGHTDDGVD